MVQAQVRLAPHALVMRLHLPASAEGSAPRCAPPWDVEVGTMPNTVTYGSSCWLHGVCEEALFEAAYDAPFLR